jgi:hypothetical protein
MSMAAVGASVVFVPAAAATTFSFSAYSISQGADASLINNTVTVSATNGILSLSLFNNSSEGRMTAFYLESGAALSGVTGLNGITNLVGSTSFTTGSASPPAPNNINPSWNGNFFVMDVVSPGQVANSLGIGESMRLDFNYNGTFDFNALIDAITSNEIRMVQRFQSLSINGSGDNGSAWLVTTAVVPLPPAAWAGLAILAGLGGLRTVKRRQR